MGAKDEFMIDTAKALATRVYAGFMSSLSLASSWWRSRWSNSQNSLV